MSGSKFGNEKWNSEQPTGVIMCNKRWQEGSEPKQKGFYAIHYSWCINEGSFMSNDYFNGKEWSIRDNPISHFAGPFKNPDEADEFCDKNDITW